METQKMANIPNFSKQLASKSNIYWEGRMKVTSTGSQLDFISFVYNGECCLKEAI